MLAAAVWFFLVYQIGNPSALPVKSIEFRWWVDCEDARASMYLWNGFFAPGAACVEGVPPSLTILPQ